MSVPGLSIPREKWSANSQKKIEQLADDLAKIKSGPTIKTAGDAAVPLFQRQGYLEKLGQNKNKWFKTFFVLRDSFLLSYNLQKSDFTTEPRNAIHLADCKYTTEFNEDLGREFCFQIQTAPTAADQEEGDTFIFSAASEAERQAWLNDVICARNITHATMVKLAVEIQCLSEEKGVGSVARESNTSSLGIFSNPAYIQETPQTGGHEGWLTTLGFNFDRAQGEVDEEGNPVVWKRSYFILRDSHLLMYEDGDILTKPRGAMYLVGVDVTEGDSTPEAPYPIVIRSYACGDMIEICADKLKKQQKWIKALTVGTRITYPDYKLLEKERQLLASVVLTPRAPTPRGPGGAMVARETTPSVLDEEFDIVGNRLAPGAVQPYTFEGIPLIPNPQGQLINPLTQLVVSPKEPRFSSSGEQLDPFNRPLPPGAVPMFTSTGVPIGVGPNGEHYTANGVIIDHGEPHYNAEGQKLSSDVVNAADQISTTISVAIKLRAKLKGENHAAEAVDPLGRALTETSDNKHVTMDGHEVAIGAQRVEIGGQLLTYEEAKSKENVEVGHQGPQTATITIKMENAKGEVELGTVEVDAATTLDHIRTSIKTELHVSQNFVFLIDGIPLTRGEEKSRYAVLLGGELVIRGQEMKVDAPEKKFTTKVAVLKAKEEQAANNQNEFLEILNKVKNKQFLNPVGRDLTK